MAKVTNLAIKLQSDSGNTYFASWAFEETTGGSSTSSSDIKKGSLVTIKSGAKYYNGVSIPDWVMSDQWYISYLSGDRAVLGKNKSGTHDIQSPINTSNLVSGSGGSSTTTSKTKTLDHYTVTWYYATGDGIWFSNGSSDVKTKYSTYSPPDNALKIKVKVKPVSKKYKSNKKEKSYWTGENVTKVYNMAASPPADPATPSVVIEDLKLTATLDNISDARTDKIAFQIYNGTKRVKTGTVTVKACQASFSCTVTAGGKYRVRCRAINIYGGSDVYSDNWSDFSSEQSTAPSGVTGVKCKADSKNSAKVTWTASSTATSYKVEYTTDKKYFDTSSSIQSATSDTNTAYITGLDTGETWFFRVCAVNSNGDSPWSDIVSTVIGSEPEPPTTWSLSSSAIVGEDVTLYWAHNSEDGSKQTAAKIYLSIGGNTQTIDINEGTDQDEDEEPVYSYTFSTSAYTEGANIRWRVRTKGILDDFSDWSTVREIKLYATPTLQLTVPQIEDGTLTKFPLSLELSAGPTKQKPLSYHVAITAREAHESTDILGNTVRVMAGETLYSKVLNTTKRAPIIKVSAGNIVLENNQTYDITATVSMDSGLTATSTVAFTVEWEEYEYTPDASIVIDLDTLSAYITPYCRNSSDALVKGVTLSVYRRQHDGTFTEVATGLKNNGVATVTDPHPSLDYARYRVVAVSSTGGVVYTDLPGEPVGETAIIVQWDEDWTEFDYSEEEAPEVPPWTGSMVRLPYNVSVTESYSPDVELVEYIGREHPVSYYGTQKGVTASWSAVIPKSDKETIYALRRLAAWQGNVYIREPSGMGYWANITVSVPIKSQDLTVPVTLEISRVEGGV